MYNERSIKYIKALTPVHAGAGDGLEIVDMPIQREKHSGIPKIEASSLKGSIKHCIYNKIKAKQGKVDKTDKLYEIFGKEDEPDSSASKIGFTDAKLLLFPVKSAKDIFKLVTCPYIIKRWVEDLKLANDKKIQSDFTVDEGEFKTLEDNETKMILEEYIFKSNNSKIEKEDIKNLLLEKDIDTKRIVILNDSDFIDLVTMYTEIITRNKIDVDTGAAADTGLFTEEYLPAETIMYFLVLGAPEFNESGENAEGAIKYFENNFKEEYSKVFQVGGNSTIGKGFVKLLDKEGVKENGKK